MRAVFYTLLLVGIWAGVEMASIQFGCPGGLGVVNCFVDPCTTAKLGGCHGHPDATCKSNYCGGCNAEWYDASDNQVFCLGVTSFPQKG